ncbi:serine protease grass-like [Ochlerotatus camptorhynchus]|uniref:serine protease grass-like n=1 Tax=Ochlerotatus camptorhynchus TaxID=644619 RepID=UPI0031E1F0F9
MNSRTCGIQGDDRISKGQVAKPFEFPWMALLRNKQGEFVCGGTLVSSRFILTAAHCIRYRYIVSVRLGENDINQDEDCIVLDGEKECTLPPQDIAVEQEILHPEYSERHKKNDIALLQLQKAATLHHSVQPICLPDGTPGQRMLEPTSYIVSGWGLTTEHGTASNVLRYAVIPSVTLERCAVSVRNLVAWVRLDESHFCAGEVDQMDNCSGDSGGPLQYISNRTSRFVQQGVVAFGIKSCGEKSEPGVYTNVGYFISWIFKHVDE